MGEYADRMIDGEDCERCGMPLMEALGFPGLCEDCQREGESGRKEVRNIRRQIALNQFAEALELAASKKLILRMHSDQHYSLTNGHWHQNIYPGNQRLYWDRNRPKPKFLKLPSPWTLLDIVKESQP